MILIFVIDLVVIGVLVFLAVNKGLERALPWAAFILVILPWESRIPLPGMFDLTTQRLLLIVLAILCVVFGSRGDVTTRVHSTPLKWLILAHIGWVCLSTANSVVPVASFKQLLAQVFEYCLLYYIVTKSVTKLETVHRIVYAIVAAVAVCCVFGAVEAYESWSVLSLFPASSGPAGLGPLDSDLARGLRVRATFPHPILFGVAIAVAIPLTLYLLTRAKSGRERVFLWTTVMLEFLNIYKTVSRGPWLALMFAWTLLFVLSYGHMRRYVIVIFLLTGAVLILRPGVRETVLNIYLNTQDTDTQLGSSYQYRYALIDVARQALGKDFRRQLWGYGLESFRSLGLEGEFEGAPHKFLSCDSAWIQFAVETGYVGLVLLAALLLKAALITLKYIRKIPRPANLLSLVFLIGMAQFYFMMTNVALYAWGQDGYVLWLLLAGSLAYGRLRLSEIAVQENQVWQAAGVGCQPTAVAGS